MTSADKEAENFKYDRGMGVTEKPVEKASSRLPMTPKSSPTHGRPVDPEIEGSVLNPETEYGLPEKTEVADTSVRRVQDPQNPINIALSYEIGDGLRQNPITTATYSTHPGRWGVPNIDTSHGGRQTSKETPLLSQEDTSDTSFSYPGNLVDTTGAFFASVGPRRNKTVGASGTSPHFLRLTSDGKSYEGPQGTHRESIHIMEPYSPPGTLGPEDDDGDGTPVPNQGGQLMSPIRIDVTSDRPFIFQARPASRQRLVPTPSPKPSPRSSAIIDCGSPISLHQTKAERILGTNFATVSDSPTHLEHGRPPDLITSAPPVDARIPSFDSSRLSNLQTNNADGYPLPSELDVGPPSPKQKFSGDPRKVRLVPTSIDAVTGVHTWPDNIARTPYPLSDSGQRDSSTFPTGFQKDSILRLLLYGHTRTDPRVFRVVVPARNVFSSTDPALETDKHLGPPMFDDERLFNLIRGEYYRVRRPLRRWISLRGLRALRMGLTPRLSFGGSMSAESGGMQQSDMGLQARKFCPERMLDYFQRPSQGRGKHKWIDWVHRLPASNDYHGLIGEKIAIEFVEGWCVAKIIYGTIVVLLASLTAGLLWIFLGVSGTPGPHFGFKDAGERVETGVVLAGFVMLVGWMLMGLWALLSWLIA